ncbi:HAD family hydrolase [Cryobacterium sp. N22]|uniref:HAD family hydrolase n=1 Tax=Cryobacterium sp. N22 TaxID=2048290 RepID=UPI000CE32455|nr:HAD family hydrolase [Cryobacterium sp. N22]
MNSSTKPRTAVLLDIDGTLVESNYLHIDAWDRAFVAVGHPVQVWRIHRAIGMDSGMLLRHLLGGDVADAVGGAAKEKHTEFYLARAERLRPIPGAQDLLAALAGRGHAVVLATSAPEEELTLLLSLLDADEHLAAVTSSADVDTAKPDPDIIKSALGKVSVGAAHAVMVGDSVWDVEAARRTGVDCIGLLSGGFGAEELLSAGAIAVYDDAADLLAQLDGSPIAHL